MDGLIGVRTAGELSDAKPEFIIGKGEKTSILPHRNLMLNTMFMCMRCAAPGECSRTARMSVLRIHVACRLVREVEIRR